MQLKPIKSRLIVEPPVVATQTSFGLILPSSAQQKPSEAKILAAGPGTKKNPMTAKPGDTVLYRPGSGEFFMWEGKQYLTLKEDAILGTK